MTLTEKPPLLVDSVGGDTRSSKPPRSLGDRLFSGAAVGSGIFILIVLAGVALFLISEAWPAFTNDLTEIEPGNSLLDYAAPLVFGTLWASALALLLATPPAVFVALYISHYAPPKLARTFGAIVDLLAAIPSVVYGLWGIFVLAPALASGVYPWLEDNVGPIPVIGRVFAGPAAASGRTMLTAGIVLAVMILPIITAISREVFLQTPRLHEEAAMALGATKWEMIRMAVLPYSRSAVISGAMLGLGRALGETMAVALVLSPADIVTVNSISPQNSNTIAANIALKFPESTGLEVNRLVATGLALFAITLVVNMSARWVVSRRSEFSGAN
ncbi:MAG: phosphate ABC transporter permease subunit PstC [Acidimicrobiales bacterium]|nr:phosphate ABC transporter permease subunit PstC [Acidimicrobiales bacterium]